MDRGTEALAISWNDSKKEKKGTKIALFLVAMLSTSILSAPAREGIADAGRQVVSVIVRAAPGEGPDARRAIEGLGGSISLRLGILHGFVADVPAAALRALGADPSIAGITPDSHVQLHGAQTAAGGSGSLREVTTSTRALDAWRQGATGEGVDVAVIDTGVSPVHGLDGPDKVVYGPDLSFDSQVPELAHLDAYGHGTHIAGIIAGRDPAVAPGQEARADGFLGVAPGARIVSVKVGDTEGAVDVSQVIAAIDWVVQHRQDGDLDIRVLNISFGTDGVQDYVLDPLAYAAEVAWRKGIVVVAAAGNHGFGGPALSNPASDPFVIAVGADDPGNRLRNVRDDAVPEWSARNQRRHVDVIAPGASIESLRVPGSWIDDAHPGARRGQLLFSGSGTSQASAVVSGAAALLIEDRPSLTPDQVKWLLMESARVLPEEPSSTQGRGVIDIAGALSTRAPSVVQEHTPATGLGSLEQARGSLHLTDEDGVVLQGEIDIFGAPWTPSTWAPAAAEGTAWSGGIWNGSVWTGDGWTATPWAGKAWAGKAWAQGTWAGKAWAGKGWAGKGWAGKGWAGGPWAGKGWAGKGWAGKAWGGKGWAGITWA